MLGVLIALGGCHKESKSATSPATPKASVATPAVTQTTRPAQETAFIRECLAVGLRPTLLLELESKAIAEAQGQAKAGGPTKAQLKDLRDSFSAAAAKLNEMAASPEAGRKAPLAQLLADTRAKQAANCSRLPDDLLHGEGVGLMMLEFIKIAALAPNQQEADRRAGEHFKQNWPNLINLPVQQKAALDEILKTEQQLQQVVIELNKDAELKSVQKAAIADVIKELETRAQRAANALTPERFYETLIGHQFRPNAGRLEAGEMVNLLIKEQNIVGHCIVSVIRLDLRGNRSGQTASLKLSVVHKTYADGRLVRLQIVVN
jgi:hypothetical protein